MRPICVTCGKVTHVVKTGAGMILAEDDSFQQLWAVDIYRCPSCNTEVALMGGHQTPVTGTDDATFPATIAAWRARTRVFTVR